jgi:hypothetical protein
VLAAYLVTGAIVLQLGPVCAMAANTGIVAFDFNTLVDANGKLFGIFQVCNVTGVTNSNTVSGTTVTTGGNLLTDCPIVTQTSG